MVHVVQMEAYRNRDIGVVLKHLLSRWEDGELRSLAACCKDDRGIEEVTFTGGYREDPARALSAALMMSRRITEIQDRLG